MCQRVGRGEKGKHPKKNQGIKRGGGEKDPRTNRHSGKAATLCGLRAKADGKKKQKREYLGGPFNEIHP